MVNCVNFNVCRTGRCDANLSGNTPFARYQRQKIIQNTVRVPSSLYTMNVGALSAYQRPRLIYNGVNWNQMSDRAEPHVQQPTATGATYHSSSTHRTITRLRPGALSPGGVGVDIKPLKQQAVPDLFALPELPFNLAYPIYGGKVMKTGIVAGCDCYGNGNEELLYVDALPTEVNDALYVTCSEEQCEVPCLCPPALDRQVNQYYGYSMSPSFIQQCAYNASQNGIVYVL